MSLYSLERIKVPQEAYEGIQKWARALKDQEGAVAAYLFGSATDETFNAESDFDIALIISDDSLKRQFKKPLRGVYAVDFVVYSEEEYNARKNVGGLAFVIREDGVELFPSWKWELK